MKIILLIFTVMFIRCGSGGDTSVDNSVSGNVDLKRYMGKWYEVARFEHSFQRGLMNCTAEYSLLSDGKIRVVNRGYDPSKGKWRQAEARAIIPEVEHPRRLRVAFFLWFYSDYRILELDADNYEYVLIGGSSPKYLWILTRTPVPDPAVVNMLIEKAKLRGYDTSKLIFATDQKII